MHDLLVASAPTGAPPIEVLVVSTPVPGQVQIAHRTVSGHPDVITRPTSDAVPLFWRFVLEKFGITGA